MPVKGRDKVVGNFKIAVDKIDRITTERALRRITIVGAANAARLTPVDTSNLLNSQFFTFVRHGDGESSASVLYTASYSAAVHDGGERNWQKASAESEFLRKGFERDGLNEIKRIIQEEYSNATND